MKLKYFISFFALLGLLSSCSDDDTMTLLDEIQVSSSYVAIDEAGGSNTITLKAKEAWTFDAEEIPDWLTVSPMSGGAGETTVTFTAPATPDGRTSVLHVACADKKQTINVIQGLSQVSEATCAEVIAGPEGKTYRVTGTVTRIENTVYGNWWLVDETGEIYIYGTLDKAGKTKNFLSLGLETGDIVTVEGPKTVYGTKIELVDVTVLNIQKSLIKVEGFEPNDTIALEGGNVKVNLSCKSGNGITVELPDSTKEWLSIASVNGGPDYSVTFTASRNEGGDRKGSVVFKTTDDEGKEYTAEALIHQKGAVKSCSMAEFLAAPVGDAKYRITGVITQVADAETGNIYVRDWSDKTVYAYHVGAKGEFKATGLKAGDVITLEGKRSEYQGNPQMSSGAIVDYKVVTPVTIAEFLAKEDDPDVYYMVTGTIDEIKDPLWGNLYLTDGSGRLYVYGTYPGWGATGTNRQNWLSTANIEVGDELTVIGVRSTFGDVVELKGGIYFSHEKGD